MKPFEIEMELKTGGKGIFKGEQQGGLAWVEIPGLTPKTTFYRCLHIATGLELAADYKTKTAARKLITQASKITDWSQITKTNLTSEIYEQFKTIRASIAGRMGQ